MWETAVALEAAKSQKVAIVNRCLPVSESLVIVTVRVVIRTHVQYCAQEVCQAPSVVTRKWVGDWKFACRILEKVPACIVCEAKK